MTVGSSPLVRGQPVIFPPLSVRARIIPARAGPTPFAISVASSVADHPRSCGANLMFSSAFFISSGSSPLVRGQPSSMIPTKSYARIIPARAGPTVMAYPFLKAETDHPRSCGANELTSSSIWRSAGSSPLVRGQPHHRTCETDTIGIIPARAGPTRRWPCVHASHTDHPRSCGANRRWMACWPLQCGSSPLVRGQRGLEPSKATHCRIIPARAGPTYQKTDVQTRYQDHPRSCGANL